MKVKKDLKKILKLIVCFNMGYTRYWKSNKRVLDDNKFKHFSHICKLVIESMNIPLDDITINDNIVRFNGVGDDAHETFVFSKKIDDFNFCKTQRKPYDELVCACLEFAKNIFKDDISVSSDGENLDEEVRQKIKKIIRDKKIENLLD